MSELRQTVDTIQAIDVGCGVIGAIIVYDQLTLMGRTFVDGQNSLSKSSNKDEQYCHLDARTITNRLANPHQVTCDTIRQAKPTNRTAATARTAASRGEKRWKECDD